MSRGIPSQYQGRAFRFAWPYHNADGGVIGHVVRYDGTDGSKSVIPFFKRNGTDWEPAAAPEPRPLFNVHELATAPADADAFIVEGEKCAAALASLGMTCTTSPGGANAAHSADWKPLQRFRRAIILPDADAPGESYAAAVARELAALPGTREVFICRLPGLPEHGDIVDWLRSRVPSWDEYDAVPREPGDDLADELLSAIREHAEPMTAAAAINVTSDDGAWPEPIPLDAAAVPRWPSVFPEPVQAFVDALAAWTETPPELGSMAALATLAACVQGKHCIESKPGHSEPLALWTLCALPPGSRKSAVFGACTFPLIRWERDARERMQPDIAAIESEAKTHADRVAQMRRTAAKTDDDEARRELTRQIAEAEAAIPKAPKPPRLFTADCTPERLALLMAENHGAIAILADEAGFLETFAGRYSNGVANIDVLLQGHSGTPVRVDRTGRDSVFFDAAALSVGIAPQNSVLHDMAHHDSFRGRGLLARFLFAVPRPTLGKRTHTTPEMPHQVMAAYNSTIKALLDRSWPLDDAGHVVPHTLRLSAEAYQQWLAFTLSIEPELMDGGRFGHLSDFGGKLPGAVARVAGILHLAAHAFENAAAIPVSVDTMRGAVELGHALAAHALIAFDAMSADAALDDARHVLSWIIRQGKAAFTKRDAYAALRSRFPRADDISEALGILAERHFVRPVPQSIKPQGGRPSASYEVNPAILGAYNG